MAILSQVQTTYFATNLMVCFFFIFRPIVLVTVRNHDARSRDLNVITKFIIYILVSMLYEPPVFFLTIIQEKVALNFSYVHKQVLTYLPTVMP